MLKLHNISKTFEVEDQKIHALQDVSLEVKEGEFFTIIGPSGCGKSTLLRIITGLQPHTSGHINWEKPAKLSMVFQNYAVFPYLTVAENIEFGLKMNNVDKNKRQEIVKELVGEMGLEGFEDKHPKELSGGMKQRVGIARSLAVDPNVLLMDEPFSSLDEFTAETLRQVLLEVWKRRKITIILVTHLVREAVELSDRIAVMSKAPGHIIEEHTVTFPRPRNSRSQEFYALEDAIIKRIQK